MGAPKCKLCGHNHWSSEPHKFPDEQERVKESAKTAQESPVTVQSEKVEAESGPVENSHTKVGSGSQSESVSNTGPAYDKGAADRVRRWRENNRDEYNQYMREYRKKKARQE